MSKDYIPGNNGEFMAFQSNLNTQVTANTVAWGIPAAEATALTTWSTGYDPLFQAILNKNQRTREQVIAHDVYKKDYVEFLRTFCQSFLTNNLLIPVSERVAMGLNPRGLNPRTERPDILTAPIPSLTPLGGGMVRFSFKVAESNTRTARHPDSNGVEVFYKLEPVTAPEPVTINDTVEEDEIVINTETETKPYLSKFSTRARFVDEFGLDNIGKRLTVYARWINTSEPSKNGPFSATISMVVS